MAAYSADFRPSIDINLGVGYVSESSIPRASIQTAYEHVLEDSDQYGDALNYGPPAGVLKLTEAIRQDYAQRLGRDLPDNQRIIIGASGATSLLEAAAIILRRGIVITSDPVYYIYTDLLERLGYELLAIPEDATGLDVEKLAVTLDQLGSRTGDISFVYLVTVANPTCTVLSNRRRKQIVEVVTNLSKQVGRKIPLLLDTAYEPLVHDPTVESLDPLIDDDPLGIVYEIGSLSKIFAPALRLGYLIGRDGFFTNAMVQKASDTNLGPPPLNQYVATQLFERHLADQHTSAKAVYHQKAQQVRQWIVHYLDDQVAECRGGRAGFYYYLTLKDTPTHEHSNFFRYLTRTTGDDRVDRPDGMLDPRVIYVPGEFCVHRGGDLTDVAKRQLRLSYGFEDLPKIEIAIRLIGEAIDYAQYQKG